MSELDLNRVLVAEDEPISRQIIISCLKSWKFEVEEAKDGEEAIMALRRPSAPHLALIDWEMPKMDGIEICERVRTAERTIYIIMLTSKAKKEDLLAALQAGADDYMVKPCDPDELRVRLAVGQRVIGLQARLEEQVRELSQLKYQLDAVRKGHTSF